ncbi:MAG: addiction module antidote protein [Nitrosomonadaceae bacterium]|nr:addiction module antidote protein [Nitrosomonadaceae bacterium]
MADKRTYKTLNESEEDYYRSHPDEIDGYLIMAFEEYAKDGCTAALLAQLRMIVRVKGVSALAQETGIAQNGNPEFESIYAIMHAMGYRLFLRCGAAHNTSYFHRYTS